MFALRPYFILAAAALFSTTLGLSPASATEPGEGVQWAPGAGVGGLPGLAPPQGFSTYFGATYNSTSATNGSGTKGYPQVTDYATYAGLLWTPGWKLFGADYYAGVGLAVLDVTLGFGNGQSFRTDGLASPGIKPIGLSWALPNHFFLETGLSVYLPIGQYDQRSALVAGNNYWTIQPDIGLTYLNDGWNLSLHLLYDFNTENTTTHYTSGDLFTAEFTAGKSFGKWTFGGGGYYWGQVTNDHNGGVPLGSFDATVVGQHGINPNGVDWPLGPYVSYDFGSITMTLRWLQDVYTRNTTTAGIGDGSHVTLNFFVPL